MTKGSELPLTRHPAMNKAYNSFKSMILFLSFDILQFFVVGTKKVHVARLVTYWIVFFF